MIHPLTNIHPEAKIGKNVEIGAFTTIEKDVVIGDNTWIGSNVVIFDGARIGENCKIFPGASISAIPQDLKFEGEVTTTEIGKNTTIREFVTISRGTKDRWKTVVGENVLIMAYAHVAHDVIIGNNCILVNGAQLAGHVTVDEFAIISGFTLIQQFSKIGSHVIISGGSHINKDIPPYVKAARQPISFIGINTIGLRRRGFSVEKIEEIHQIYRIIYQSGLPVYKAIEKIEAEIPQSTERDYIINFYKTSKKGVMRGGSSSSKDKQDEDIL